MELKTEQQVEQEAMEHLSRIEGELEEIKKRTPGSRRSFINGIWQGAGAIVGSILALVLLGWALSFFGLLPGFGVIAHYLQNVVSELHSGR